MLLVRLVQEIIKSTIIRIILFKMLWKTGCEMGGCRGYFFWANPSLIFLWSAFTLNDWKVKTFMPIRHTLSMSRYLRSSSPMTFITKIVVQFMWFTDKSTMDHGCPNIVKLITLERRCFSHSRNSKYLMKLMLPLKHLKLFTKLKK